MAHLPDLGRLPLTPTGVVGDIEPGIWEFDHGPTLVKRMKMEYEWAQLDRDPGLQNTLLTIAGVANDDDYSLARIQWTFHINGLYDIVVRFPYNFPFKAPYYYIKTFGDVQTDLKEFLIFAARQAGGEVQEYVNTIDATDLNPTTFWSPAKRVVDHVKRLVNDPLLSPLLEQASMTHVHRGADDAPFLIYVKSARHMQTVKVTVSNAMTVDTLKTKVAELLSGIPVEQMRLVHRGRVLENGRTLGRGYSVAAEDTIFLE